MPVKVDEAWKARLKAECPEMPFDKQRRFMKEYDIPYTITSVLIPDKSLSDYFEATAKLCGQAHAAGNWIANDLLREIGKSGESIDQCKIKPNHLAALIKLITAGTISTTAAREVFSEMASTGELPEKIVERKGLTASASSDDLETWCKDSIASDPKALAEFKAGKDSAINAFKGPVMKAAKGKANPKLVDETLRRLLAL